MTKRLLILLLLCMVSAAAQGQDVVVHTDRGIVVDITKYIPTNKTVITSAAWGSGAVSSGANYRRIMFFTNFVSGVPIAVTGVISGNFRKSTPLTSIVIPNGETTIRSGAFHSCIDLANVTIPNSVTNIGADAFAYCHSLTNITIPASVATIGARAFTRCGNLKGVYFKGNAPQLGAYAFFEAPITIYYLPSTTGWDKTFGGRPTAEWKP